MSIRVVCANGHVINAKDKYAGKVCLCPICRVRITISEPEKDIFPENAIMDVLQPHESGLSGPAAIEKDNFPENSIMDILQPQESGLSGLSLDVADLANEDALWDVPTNADNVETICAKCQTKMSTSASVCPHCHTYVASLQD